MSADQEAITPSNVSEAQWARDQIQHLEKRVERLNAALQRIEQLEADVARLKGPRPEVPSLHDPEFYAKLDTWMKANGWKPALIAVSPATAYPPLPDEGT